MKIKELLQIECREADLTREKKLGTPAALVVYLACSDPVNQATMYSLLPHLPSSVRPKSSLR